MKIKNIVLSAAVAVGAAVNVYLANDIRELTNNLSLLTLENIAEAQETNPGDAGGCGYATKGLLTFDEKDNYKVVGCGFDPQGTYHDYLEITYVYWYCDETNDNPCTPKTVPHYSYGG
jgi:hypothetical protein